MVISRGVRAHAKWNGHYFVVDVAISRINDEEIAESHQA